MSSTPPPPSYDSLTTPAPLCATCAHPLDSSTSKPPPHTHPCCNRTICSTCLTRTPRFTTYCPFCPVSTNVLPPSYSPPASPAASPAAEKPPAEPIALHYLIPTDTIASLSLAYNVSVDAIRQHNRIWDDFLLQGRETVEIPGAEGSLRPDVEDRAKRERDVKRRRVMMEMKGGWEEAEVYLSLAGGDVEAAVERWKGDKEWEERTERERQRNRKGKGRAWGLG